MVIVAREKRHKQDDMTSCRELLRLWGWGTIIEGRALLRAGQRGFPQERVIATPLSPKKNDLAINLLPSGWYQHMKSIGRFTLNKG